MSDLLFCFGAIGAGPALFCFVCLCERLFGRPVPKVERPPSRRVPEAAPAPVTRVPVRVARNAPAKRSAPIQMFWLDYATGTRTELAVDFAWPMLPGDVLAN